MSRLTLEEVSRLQIAERLDTLTDGLARVVYCPEALLAGQERASREHKFYCFLESEPTEFWLDDRAPQPLNVQLARSLRELAARMNDLAEKLASESVVV